jgi:hypothetical protein
MRVMPIDDFLSQSEQGDAAGLPETHAYDWARMVREGRTARQAADGGAWRIGQLAALVERRYRSGALKRFAEEIGESAGTVRRYRWVAAAYDERARARFADLSFSHFQAVAGLPQRLTWLERAQRGRWSVDRLVRTVRADTRPGTAQHLRMRAPVDAAAKRIGALADADDRVLARAARAGLAEAVEELAAQLERLRARLRAAQKRSMKLAR